MAPRARRVPRGAGFMAPGPVVSAGWWWGWCHRNSRRSTWDGWLEFKWVDAGLESYKSFQNVKISKLNKTQSEAFFFLALPPRQSLFRGSKCKTRVDFSSACCQFLYLSISLYIPLYCCNFTSLSAVTLEVTSLTISTKVQASPSLSNPTLQTDDHTSVAYHSLERHAGLHNGLLRARTPTTCQADAINSWGKKRHLPYPAAEPVHDRQHARARDFVQGNLYWSKLPHAFLVCLRICPSAPLVPVCKLNQKPL